MNIIQRIRNWWRTPIAKDQLAATTAPGPLDLRSDPLGLRHERETAAWMFGVEEDQTLRRWLKYLNRTRRRQVEISRSGQETIAVPRARARRMVLAEIDRRKGRP